MIKARGRPMPRQRVNWQTVRLEYISDRSTTYVSLATKYSVPERTLRWHAKRERWREERDLHCLKVAKKLTVNTANRSVVTVAKLNEQHLERSNHLRALLDTRLYEKTLEGK